MSVGIGGGAARGVYYEYCGTGEWGGGGGVLQSSLEGAAGCLSGGADGGK